MEHKDTKADMFSFDGRDFCYLVEQCTDPVPAYAVDTASGSFVVVPATLWEQETSTFITTEYSSIRLGGESIDTTIHFSELGLKVVVIPTRAFKKLVREVKRDSKD